MELAKIRRIVMASMMRQPISSLQTRIAMLLRRKRWRGERPYLTLLFSAQTYSLICQSGFSLKTFCAVQGLV